MADMRPSCGPVTVTVIDEDGTYVRCLMVEIIGLGTMSALVWLLAWSMTKESDSERRRVSRASGCERAVEADRAPLHSRTAA